MKVEHITFPGNSVVRDTDIIEPATVDHFRNLQVDRTTKGVPIDKTIFSCDVIIQEDVEDIAIFDLKSKDGKRLYYSNTCCFSKNSTDAAFLYANDLAKELNKARGETRMLVRPKIDMFIISFIVDPRMSFVDAAIAGEIELYIYDAIRRGLDK